MTGQALPLEELLSFSSGEMLALKRRGWLPHIAEIIAAEIMEPRYSGGRQRMRSATGAVFYGSDPPTEFERLVETITGIMSNWGPEGRSRLEAIVKARRKFLPLGLSIEADFAEFPWLSDRLVAIE